MPAGNETSLTLRVATRPGGLILVAVGAGLTVAATMLLGASTGWTVVDWAAHAAGWLASAGAAGVGLGFWSYVMNDERRRAVRRELALGAMLGRAGLSAAAVAALEEKLGKADRRLLDDVLDTAAAVVTAREGRADIFAGADIDASVETVVAEAVHLFERKAALGERDPESLGFQLEQEAKHWLAMLQVATSDDDAAERREGYERAQVRRDEVARLREQHAALRRAVEDMRDALVETLGEVRAAAGRRRVGAAADGSPVGARVLRERLETVRSIERELSGATDNIDRYLRAGRTARGAEAGRTRTPETKA